MAEFKAIKKSVRMSPRKARLIADIIRGKKVGEAIAILKNSESTRCESILKTLESSIANAQYAIDVKKEEVNMDALFIKDIQICEGTMLKRFQPRAKGSGYRILKRTSHIFITVADAK